MDKSFLGRGVIITGGSKGLGFEMAKQFATAGANLLVCARNKQQLEIAHEELTQHCIPGTQKIRYIVADVSQEKDCELVVDRALSELGGCDTLINNAGVYGPKGEVEDVEWQDWLNAMNINLFGSILMCRALLPHLKKQRFGKIIQLSGGGATQPLPRLSAYAVSKAAIVRFVESLALEVQKFGIDVNAVAPGALNTAMLDEVIGAGPEKVGREFFDKAVAQKAAGGTPLILGANLALFLASHTSDGITGKLISAVWDDWSNFTMHLNELTNSDVYTLRRISARDRGFQWGDK